MRTLRQVNAYFKKHNIKQDTGARGYDFRFHIGDVKHPKVYQWTPDSWENSFGCVVSQSTFCCGVFEAGSYSGFKTSVDHWAAILEYMLLKTKHPYLRTETITLRNEMKNIDEALAKVGFKLVTTVKSKHGKGKYDIKVWEWLKA